MAQAHILVVDDNEISAKLVADVLERRDYRVTVKTDPIAALNWLRVPGDMPELVVLDLMMPRMNGYEFLRQVRMDPTIKHLPVILLTARSQMDDKVAGFEAGADDYLVKPVNAIELELRIRALLGRAQTQATSKEAPAETVVVVVFSLRGGVGTTSLAVNLAVALATMWRIKVPLVDLAVKNGHCALMLNLKPKYSIVDLAELKEDTIEFEVFDNLLINHESGVRLLPAPFSPLGAELITTKVLDKAWPYLRGAYRFVVIDAGSELSDVALTAMERATHICLLLCPELASLKATTDLLRVFDELNYERKRILPVMNWTFPKDGLPQRSIEKALGFPIEDVIPYERTAFVRAINGGRPLVMVEPECHASLSIAKLAYKMSSAQMDSDKITQPPPLLVAARKLMRSG